MTKQTLAELFSRTMSKINIYLFDESQKYSKFTTVDSLQEKPMLCWQWRCWQQTLTALWELTIYFGYRQGNRERGKRL